jgi:hypothetical protein
MDSKNFQIFKVMVSNGEIEYSVDSKTDTEVVITSRFEGAEVSQTLTREQFDELVPQGNDEDGYEAGLAEVDRILSAQYGLGINDVDGDGVLRDLRDREHPQAIVDDIADKHDLTRTDSGPYGLVGDYYR